MQYLKETLKNFLSSQGYQIQRVPRQKPKAKKINPQQQILSKQKQEYFTRAQTICDRHKQQTKETVTALNKKYQEPVFGKVSVWSLVERLAQCIDPSDCRLFSTNQQVHVLQILEGMERDSISDPDFILAALIHDLGKTLLLTDEVPENIVGFNSPIGDYEEGIGLDNCVFQWNHDEFAYSRLKYHVPDHISWLIRYHSIRISECEPLMDERDRSYLERYLRVFYKYDHDTKSIYALPKKRIEDYRDLIEETFPKPILF